MPLGHGQVPDGREGGHVHRGGQVLRVRPRLPAGRDAGDGLQRDGQGDCGGRAVRLQWHHIRLRADLVGQDAHHGGQTQLREDAGHHSAHRPGHLQPHLRHGRATRVPDQGLLLRDLHGQDQGSAGRVQSEFVRP